MCSSLLWSRQRALYYQEAAQASIRSVDCTLTAAALHACLCCFPTINTDAAFHAGLCSCATADVEHCSTVDMQKRMFVITALLLFIHCLAEVHSRSCISAVTELNFLQFMRALIATRREIDPRLG